ncbi:mitochondrial ATPase expression-domain-containing protein [Xylariaceae sp. FL1019]|nr:mitochondrial ATPase expression-domain-containing protein [Xylariaceae sp. FL1019]
MLPSIHAAEHNGCRALMRRAPRGTPSRIISLRLHRSLHNQNGPSRPSLQAHPIPTGQTCIVETRTGSIRCATTQSSPASLSQDAVALAHSLLQARATPVDLKGARAAPYASRSKQSPHEDDTVPGSRNEIPNAFRRALSAARDRDTRRLLINLKTIENMSLWEKRNAVKAIPRTTFTEFFRALDPFLVDKDCDPTHGVPITYGMFMMLQMESTIDDWGVRKLYSGLLRTLLGMMSILRTEGFELQHDEYMILLRCAGAATDIIGAKTIWKSFTTGPPNQWKGSTAYTEYIKARFLTEPLYTGYSKTRRMVTPRALHRSRLLLSRGHVKQLDILRVKARARQLRFGLNKDAKGRVEDQFRLLRCPPSVGKLQDRLVRSGFLMDEELVCALLVAASRTGSLDYIKTNILPEYFNISIEGSTSENNIEIRKASYDDSSHRVGFKLPVTARLLRAITEAYGSNAEIGTALQLVEFVSRTEKVRIPSDVWRDLLEWTYIMSTPPASLAWEAVGFYERVPAPQAVEMLFNAMVSHPYNQKPTFEHYHPLIHSLIRGLGETRNHNQALERMREAVQQYHEQWRAYEDAVFAYTQALRDGVASSETTLRLERTRFEKQKMWNLIRLWCQSMLKEWDPADGPSIHEIIDEFRPFLENPITYQIKNGYVELVDPTIEKLDTVATGGVNHVTYYPEDGEDVGHPISQVKIMVQSSHSLTPLKPSDNPLDLLAPERHRFLGLRRPRGRRFAKLLS